MRGAVYHGFGEPLEIVDLDEPIPAPDGVVVRVEATGVCRSDWHGWQGHDDDISVLPHVPGHELAGRVVAIGAGVQRFSPGDRVTVPFICACGTCGVCESGNHQVCPHQQQPGFHHWGSFAEQVALRHADTNLIRLPESIDAVTAASLGCRFATSFRAVTDRARVAGGEWLVVHGCGGVGLSAVMIGAAVGARVIGVDVDDAKLALARECGAMATLRADETGDVAAAIVALTEGGAHVSIDALGSRATAAASILGLRRRGRHVQIGLLAGDDSDPPLPMGRAIAFELDLLGSHGIQAHEYPRMLGMIESGSLDPSLLIGARVDLARGIEVLQAMDRFSGVGATVIEF